MIDERELREMLERRAGTISASPTDAPKATRRARWRLLRNGAVTTIAGIAVIAAAFAGGRAIETAPKPADRPVQPSPIKHVGDQPAQRPPIKGLEFPMLEGARPSTPITGDAVVDFNSWPGGDYPVELGIYADGRVIWHPNQNDVGFFQLRLTPAGVDKIRSMIISSGLFDHDLQIVGPGFDSRLTIVRGNRSVYVQWAKDSSWLVGGNNPRATPSESRNLAEIDRLLSDPSAWQLSADLYADPEIRPFVPSGFLFEYDRGEPDLSQLPSPARDLLARYDPGSTKCSVVTTDVVRKIARALARAGFAPLTNTPTYLDWKLPGQGGGPSNPHLNAQLPHELNCDTSG
jgi:hypothetical protein